MAAFCKKKGLVYPSSELYGGLAGFFDYGPYGSTLKRNIKDAWWKFHVDDRQDIVGIDASIMSPEAVWRASGHLASFADLMLESTKGGYKYRADKLIEEVLGLKVEGKPAAEIDRIVKEHGLVCPRTKAPFKPARAFSQMLPVQVEEGRPPAYLRGETAQMIFTNFRLVQEHARLALPFGIAQVGKAFRNEISPRNFLFRMREFEQMEIEYFIHPSARDCPFLSEVGGLSLNVCSAAMQERGEEQRSFSVEELLKGRVMIPWHVYWLALEVSWFVGLGVRPENLRVRQHLADEKSHYSSDTWDLEYRFPFGWQELEGIANRTDYDLRQHMDASGQDLRLFDEETKEKFL
ncbi:MAG: glycine--tRNA ligase, partial [Nitrosarchaeum sp.]|nr:glycine--tRNA ligase [Nitrosarchaeum sp.]